MTKWLWLSILAVALLLLDFFFHDQLGLNSSFRISVLFFVVQTIVLFRIDQMTTSDLKIQMSMLKMAVRLLSALGFLFFQMKSTGSLEFDFVIQFMLLYLGFMTFEIILALANLRRN